LIKALFFDLDGTLLTREKKIPQKTRATLEACAAKGYQLFVATARPPLLGHMLSWDENTLALFTGGSYYNGGCIQIGEHKEYIAISEHIIRKAIDCVSDDESLNIALQLEDEKHALRFPLDDKGYQSWGVNADEILSLDQGRALRTIKILMFYENLVDSVTPIHGGLVSALRAACAGNAQFYLTDHGRCVQIMGKSVNKCRSIENIRTRLGLGKNEIAVFGDDVNDMEMLSEYPFSVAMGNAQAQVKAAANYSTADNDSEGIHEAICHILKLL